MQDTMKLHYMYWTLLISFVSSGLLFLIVGSEGIPGSISKFKSKHELLDNITVKDSGKSNDEIIDALNILNSEIKLELNDKSNEENEYTVNEFINNDENTPTTDIPQTNNLNVLKESLTQQPNLSQGISQTGQAVVLTLVDTASSELQNLAEPHLSSDVRTQDGTKNSSQTSTLNIETDSIVTIPTSLPTVLLPVEDINNTDSDEIKQIIEDIKNGSEENIVLVVRAEQKSIEDLSKNSFDSIIDINDKIIKSSEDTYKIDESLSSSGEFDNEATRSKLSVGSSEEAASIILDGVVSPGTVEHHEDIPSFSEWAQKRLEEAEKKKTHPNASIQNPGGPGRGAGGMKVRSKNYASPDCGAKIVAVNPEARSARSVLVSTRDEYMLNTCTSRIWFVVELCEAIQAKKIELANFELFSSSPKEFTVFVSDRFPTRDWSAVGHFTAKDERDIQSFGLHPHLFGKFIKIELHSHYGSEHFCPISLFRAYGTSEFEVLETETENEVQETSDSADDDDDDDDEETLDSDGGESTRNLFGSARDAVIRIVKKAAAVFVKTGNFDMNNITKIQESIEDNIKSSFANCMTPRYTILCNNCTDDHFAKVFHLLGCQTRQLDSIIKISFINHALHRSELCGFYGVDLKTNEMNLNKKKFDRKLSCTKNLPARFLASVLPSEYIVALCNVIATKERKLVLNSSNEAVGNVSIDNTPTIDVLTTKFDVTDSITMPKILASCVSDVSNCQTNANSFKETKRNSHIGSITRKEESLNTRVKDTRLPNSLENFKTTEILASQIKPTKTLSKEDQKRESSVPILEPSKDTAEETIQAEVVTTPSPLLNSAAVTIKVIEEPLLVGTPVDTVTQTVLTQLNSVNNDENVVGIESVTMKVEEKEIHKSEIISGIKIEEKDDKSKDKDNDDIKLSAQEQLSLESLLSDLKDLEVDSHGQSNSASTVAPLAASSTPQQKESVFLRLSNRIKALEQNMSLSGQYLEELSRRYKKQVEEMQRSLERATAAISEELKKSEDRESKRLEEISILREELSILTESMEVLLYDRNSWKSKLSTFGQHIALIFIEIIVLVLIISYCRRSSDLDSNVQSTTKMTINNEMVRRKSAESMDSNIMKKNNKKRRPSEIASVFMNPHGDLMIDERSELKKERKKKRKRESTIGITSNNIIKCDDIFRTVPSRRASSIDCPNTKEIDYYSKQWPNSAPNCSFRCPERQLTNENNDGKNNSINCVTQNRIVIDEIDGNEEVPELIIDSVTNQHNESTDINEFDKGISRSNSPRNIGFFKNTHLHSPFFMRTASITRSKRNKLNGNNSPSGDAINSDNYEYHSRTSDSSRSGKDSPSSLIFLDSPNIDSQQNGDTSANGHYIVSDDSASGNTTPTSGKKIKKEGSLRKMVRKLF